MDNREIKNAVQSEDENKDINTAADIEEAHNESEINTDEVQKNEYLLNDEEEENNKHGIVNDIFANVMDQLIMLCLSAVILLIFSFLIKFAGYYVAMPVPVLFIIYVIIECLYGPLLKNSRLKKTIGDKIFKIQ